MKLTGSAPLFDNQPSVLRADNTFVIWDNEESKLFELDFKSHDWSCYVEASGAINREKIEKLYCFYGNQIWAVSSHCNYQLEKLDNREIKWNKSSGERVFPDAVCISEDKKVLTSLHAQKTNAEWRVDVSSFALKSNLDGTLAAHTEDAVFWLDEQIYHSGSFLHIYDGRVWVLNSEDLCKYGDMAFMQYKGQKREYRIKDAPYSKIMYEEMFFQVDVAGLPEIHQDTRFMKTQWPFAVLLVTKDSSNMSTIGFVDLKERRFFPVLKHKLLPSNIGFMFLANSKLYFIRYLDDTQGLSELGILDLSEYSRCFEPIKPPKDPGNMTFIEGFKALLEIEDFKDFSIIGIDISGEDFTLKDESILKDQYDEANPIKVHKAILMARWPYFRTLISSGMQESQQNQLFIPEPIPWIKALIEYFYTNSIPDANVSLCAGLLILAKLYNLEGLKERCLVELYSSDLTFQEALKIWEFAKLRDEPCLAYSASKICYKKWKNAEPQGLQKLDHDLLIELCLNNPYAIGAHNKLLYR